MPRLDKTFSDTDIERLICKYLNDDEKERLTKFLVSERARECGIKLNAQLLTEAAHYLGDEEKQKLVGNLLYGVTGISKVALFIGALPCYQARKMIYIFEIILEIKQVCDVLSLLDAPCDIVEMIIGPLTSFIPQNYKILVRIITFLVCFDAELCANSLFLIDNKDLIELIEFFKKLYVYKCGEYKEMAAFPMYPIPK